MKKIFLIVMFFVLCNTVYSQSMSDSISRDTVKNESNCYNKFFLGTWVATSGDYTYEVEIKERVVFYEIPNKYAICILGSIKKMQGNKMIYYREIRDTNVMVGGIAPLLGALESSKLLSLFYKELGKNKELGEVEFVLSDDRQTATWTLRGTADLKVNCNYDPFEIPLKMTFKRKQPEKK